jgi:hypothetical protein
MNNGVTIYLTKWLEFFFKKTTEARRFYAYSLPVKEISLTAHGLL